MKIRSRFDRVESVEIEIIDLLRKQREAGGQTILRINYIIHTRKRIETLAFDIAGHIQIVKTRNVRTHKAVFQTLKEEQLIFLDRTADGDTWRRGGNAVDVTIAHTGTRQRAGYQIT